MSLDRRRFTGMLGGSAAAAAAPGFIEAGRSLRAGDVVDGEDLPAREASWYKKLEEGREECKLCPQACTGADAERGT